MLDAGMAHADVAFELNRRYHGWTLGRAADNINRHAARLGIDPDGQAPMRATLLWELEQWPLQGGRRRVMPHMLVLLASVYGTDAHSLLDVRDWAALRPMHRLTVDAMACVGRPAGCILRRPRPQSRPPRVPPRPASRPEVLATSNGHVR
jgi:hypothetical protein